MNWVENMEREFTIRNIAVGLDQSGLPYPGRDVQNASFCGNAPFGRGFSGLNTSGGHFIRPGQDSSPNPHVLRMAGSKFSRRKAIMEKCLDCSGGNAKDCECDGAKEELCQLYPLRLRKLTRTGISPKKAIKSYCLWCMNGQKFEVKLCPSTDCGLWRFRLGRVQK